MWVVSIFDGIDRKLIGPFDEQEAKRHAKRLRIRASQLGLIPRASLTFQVTTHEITDADNLDRTLLNL